MGLCLDQDGEYGQKENFVERDLIKVLIVELDGAKTNQLST